MTASPRIRVMTLNVYGPANPGWERRCPVIARTIAELDPDVIALQEVPVDTPEVIEAFLGDRYHLAHFARPSDDGIAGTLGTRWPHELVDRVDLGITAEARQTLPWSETLIVGSETPVGPLVVAHHKPSWPFAAEAVRERQAVMATDALEAYLEHHDAHAVVLGDFDATPDSASLQYWRGRRPVDGRSVCYQDAWEYAHPTDPGFTFDLGNPLVDTGEIATAVSRRIDYVLVRSLLHGPTLRVISCQRVLDEPVDGVWGSDHFGVVADLALPTEPVT